MRSPGRSTNSFRPPAKSSGTLGSRTDEIRTSRHGSVWFLSATGIFHLPVLHTSIGLSRATLIAAGTCLLGFIVTRVFGIETRGRPLEVSLTPAVS